MIQKKEGYMTNIAKTAIMIALLAKGASATPAFAQDSDRANELYHIFDFKTTATRTAMAKALQDGLNPNVSNSNIITPIVMGAPPEKPGRFELYNPFENSPFAGFVSAQQMATMKQARCNGAVWISSALRKVRGSQQLIITMCLYPYVEGYHLNVYAIDIKEKGGGISARLGRALGEAVVGDSSNRTNKTILDVVRSVRKVTGAQVKYVEGQPEFTGEPWLDVPTLLPSDLDKSTIDKTTAHKSGADKQEK